MSRSSHQATSSTEFEMSVSTPSYDKQDIFFQVGDGLKLREGQTVTYDLIQGPQGQWFTVDIRTVEEPPLN